MQKLGKTHTAGKSASAPRRCARLGREYSRPKRTPRRRAEFLAPLARKSTAHRSLARHHPSLGRRQVKKSFCFTVEIDDASV